MSEETTPQTVTPKKWQKMKVFDTYEEASALKDELILEYPNSDLEIRIRRCGHLGTRFKVKTFHPKTNK
jgi:hypothetical protein|tara:strand:- start:9100 stop:9306 length:207 start_codon:yes stop_codon:yes gene_type:complete